MQHLHIANTLEEMRLIAKEIVSQLPQYRIVLLKGELGAGKTTLAQMICEILGVKEPVTSPTYTIVNEYELPNYKDRALLKAKNRFENRADETEKAEFTFVNEHFEVEVQQDKQPVAIWTSLCQDNSKVLEVPKLYHFDLYRLNKEEELAGIGFTEYLDSCLPAGKSGNICLIEWPEIASRYFSDMSTIEIIIHKKIEDREIEMNLNTQILKSLSCRPLL